MNNYIKLTTEELELLRLKETNKANYHMAIANMANAEIELRRTIKDAIKKPVLRVVV